MHVESGFEWSSLDCWLTGLGLGHSLSPSFRSSSLSLMTFLSITSGWLTVTKHKAAFYSTVFGVLQKRLLQSVACICIKGVPQKYIVLYSLWVLTERHWRFSRAISGCEARCCHLHSRMGKAFHLTELPLCVVALSQKEVSASQQHQCLTEWTLIKSTDKYTQQARALLADA